MTTSTLQNFLIRAYKVLKQSGTAGLSSPPLGSPAAPAVSSTTRGEQQQQQWASDIKTVTDSMNELNAENTNLHELAKNIPTESRRPITFVDIEQNPVMSAVVIMIQPGHCIPLHDHPGMFGLIKVLHGRITIRSYNLLHPSDEGLLHRNNKILPASRMPDVVLSSESYPQVLSPDVRNIHEIECLSGDGEHNYAAFLDLLTPPYHDESACHYFESDEVDRRKPVLDADAIKNKCHLKVTRCPKSYETGVVML
jgi:cysteamine dioxygenase